LSASQKVSDRESLEGFALQMQNWRRFLENWALPPSLSFGGCAGSKVGKKLPRITYYLPPSVELAKISALSFPSMWPTSAAGKYHPGLSKEVDDLNLLLLRSLEKEKEKEKSTSANLESDMN
jgi:hypothetical protein